MKKHLYIIIIFFCVQLNVLIGQTVKDNKQNIPVVSTAPISFRVNESGTTLYGYYKKGYNLTIYGDKDAIGFRADCDEDDDWSGAKVQGTTQSSNSFESSFRCVFDPHSLYGTVLPGNKKGQNHFEAFKNLSVGVGDLTMTIKLDKNNKPLDSVIGVVFDMGPQNQPGESSVAICKRFKSALDNNQFIYIVFPNTVKYLQKVIGTKLNSKVLMRNPVNADFEQAYKLMLSESSIGKINDSKEKLLTLLSQIPVLSNFDNATQQEKADGLLQEKNNNKNCNE